MIDKDKLFNLFQNPEGDDNKRAKELIIANPSFLEEPFTKIGMFTKLIINHHVFHQKLAAFLKREKSNVDIRETKEASQFTIYNRAWHYISKIDLTDKDHLEAIMEFKADPFISSLQDAIEYFQGPDVEEYEKCAKLKEILDLKKEFENPLPI